jgi:hypothetical protein
MHRSGFAIEVIGLTAQVARRQPKNISEFGKPGERGP